MVAFIVGVVVGIVATSIVYYKNGMLKVGK